MYKKVFIDTNPFIYLLENQQPYSDKVKNFLLDCMKDNSSFYTSTITDSEFMVKPLSIGNMSDVETYKLFLKSIGVFKYPINESVAEQAAQIRAQYKTIKLADALQLAVSIELQCDAFLTNDKQLKQVISSNVIYLGDL